MSDRIKLLEYHLSEIFGTYDEYEAMPCRSLEERMLAAIRRARLASGYGDRIDKTKPLDTTKG